MTPGLEALRILVVDDNPQMRSIVGSVLSAAGVGRLYYAANAKSAREFLRSNSVDAMYLDYEMPDGDGISMLSGLRRSDQNYRFLPTIMLTGHSDRPRICAARDAGANEFLCKPVTAKSILNRLDALISQQRPFVVTPSYAGPDRRRKAKAAYAGPERRSGPPDRA